MQVKEQVDPRWFETLDLIEVGPAAWLEEQAKPGWTIGYDVQNVWSYAAPRAPKAWGVAITQTF